MELPRPQRYAYFPPTVIFGRQLVPVYLSRCGPCVPLNYVSSVLGITPSFALKRVLENREVIEAVDPFTLKVIPPGQDPGFNHKYLCIPMQGISILIMSINHNDLADPLCRERIILAKKWLLAQITNRVKVPGRKHQARWDSGLSKEQSRDLKKQFARLESLSPDKS